MKFEGMSVLKLRSVFKVEEEGELPAYLGSMIRGVLSRSMRNLVCIAPNVQCHLCEFSSTCDYTNRFNSAGNIAGSVNSYVAHVPVRNKIHWKRGDTLTFDITIFGSSTLAAEYYVAGILSMGDYGFGVRRLRFSPVQIMNVNDESLVWSNGEMWVHNLLPDRLYVEGRATNSVLLRFHSPTRIVVSKKLQRQLRFVDVIRALLTRMRLLTHAYEGTILNWDETTMLEKAKNIRTVEEHWEFVDFKRYSRTYDRKLGLPAIEGYARYEGDLTPFTPLLEAGKVVQIGKNTTHGFGHYELYYPAFRTCG